MWRIWLRLYIAVVVEVTVDVYPQQRTFVCILTAFLCNNIYVLLLDIVLSSSSWAFQSVLALGSSSFPPTLLMVVDRCIRQLSIQQFVL